MILPYPGYELPLASVEIGIIYPDSGHNVGEYWSGGDPRVNRVLLGWPEQGG
jgi:hypothetical protein